VLFKAKVKEYIEMVINKIDAESIVITSDIIESAFGKYKNYISQNKMIGITDLALCIPAFTFDYENKEAIKLALESISAKKIKDWSNENIGKTLMKKRTEMYKTKNGV